MGTVKSGWYAWKSGNEFGFWFRLWGYGISFSNSSPMFSERYGYRKVVRIKGVKFQVLKPSDFPSNKI